ncbi:porin family protein [Rheinheimera sp. F8]|uniref:porin family protein n=1 Tax=Rheinheimera sp. F8 TaxID=1763998 RepID=UPI000744AA66|nr:porin family protein [Rheinheimera sp. F8]ALZ74720.1 hypothetical protein ATY27_02415 [Rheinheimera sp. F8]
MFKQLTIASLLIAAGAQAADTGAYAGLAFHRPTIELDAGPVELNWNQTTFSALGGYQFHPYLAVEGRIAVGANDDKVGEQGNSLTVGIDRSYALFAKASFPLAEGVDVYGLAGYDYTKFNADAVVDGKPENADTSENGFAYGVGAQYAVNDKFTLALEYLVRPDLEDEELKANHRGFGLTATFKF